MSRNTPGGLALAGLFALAACAEQAEDKTNEGLGARDGGGAHTAPGDARAATDSSGRGVNSGASNSCARATIRITRLVPTVQVVVDASGSMAEPLGDCATRWQCLREALIGERGLITELQRSVAFGLTLFGGQIAKIEDGKVSEILNATCPRLVDVAPALENRDAIATRYEVANPGGGTPTAEALQFVIDAMPSVSDQLETPIGPQIILLVTDGDPNECSDPVATAYEPTEAQALRAQRSGIELFALTVASDQNRGHLQRMANLGAGKAADATPSAPYFEPSGATELAAALRSIVGGAVGCNVALEGTVSAKRPGDECEGTVTLNGTALDCNGADGWKLDGPKGLLLQGEACERFKLDPTVMLSAEFPCELVTLL